MALTLVNCDEKARPRLLLQLIFARNVRCPPPLFLLTARRFGPRLNERSFTNRCVIRKQYDTASAGLPEADHRGTAEDCQPIVGDRVIIALIAAGV